MNKILLSTIISMLMLTVSTFASDVNFAWDASPSTGLASYKLYKSTTALTAGSATTSNPSAVVAATVPATQLTATASGLPDGLWYFSISALGTNGLESVFGNVVSLTVLNLPVAPSGLTVTALSTSQIRLNWTDNATNESGYTVERSTDNVNFTVVSGTLAAGTVTYTDSGLTANTLYYYRVKAVNATGSSVSLVASTRTLAPVAPVAPTNLRVTSVN